MTTPQPTRAPCPTDDMLAAFVERKLGTGDAKVIETHLNECDACSRVLGTYAGAYLGSAHSKVEKPTPTASGSFGGLVERLQRMPSLVAGTLVGRYVVLEWLGEGGAGVVYAAYDPKLDRKIALKLLRSQATGPPARAPVDLEAEARAMAKLGHPGVVTVHDVGTFEGHVFLAMELAGGGTLRQWLREGEHTSREIIERFLQAGRGLAAAHAAGLVHRDFKPGNVLIARDGRVKVTDFGLAFAGSEVEPSLVAAGTPQYMAPEQKAGKTPDARSDQYSFCVALREAFGAAASDRKQPPARVRRVLARGLAEAPEARYPSMNALLADLGRDPFARWKSAGIAFGAALLVASVAFAARERRAESRLLCSGAEQKLLGVWDESRKDAVRRAFLATGKVYAADAWRGTESALDAYAQSWKSMHKEACEATRVRGEQSTELLDRRMLCLDERVKELRALTDVLANADAVVVQNAVSASGALTRVAGCADAKSLLSGRKPATDAPTAAREDELRGQLAQLKAQEEAGKYKDALPLAEQVANQARAIGDRRLLGEALFRWGSLRTHAGDFGGAESTLYEAEWASDAAGDDTTRAHVLAALVFVVCERQGKFDALPSLRGRAEAALERLGEDDDASAHLLLNLGAALATEGRYDDARDAEERALALWIKVEGAEGSDVPPTLNNLGLTVMHGGHLDEALAYFQRAQGIAEKVLGPTHPGLAIVTSNIGLTLVYRLDFAEAEGWYERAVRIAEAALGPAHPALAGYLEGLGQVRAELGRYREAIELYTRTLAMRESLLPPDHPSYFYTFRDLGKANLALDDTKDAISYLERALERAPPERTAETAETRFALAEALTMEKRDRERARTLALQAKDALEKDDEARTPLGQRELARMRDWIAKHP